MRIVVILAALAGLAVANGSHAGEADAKALAQKAIAAVGGEGKILKLFEITEDLIVGSNPKAKPSKRVSVLEPPKYWWVGKRERVSAEKEPATFLVWSWTLGALTDPKSKLDALPEIQEQGKPAFGIRVGETIQPPMDLYFDKATAKLVRIDWRNDFHRFSEWKETEGWHFPSRCVGYHKKGEQAWYFSTITNLKRLSELPKGLAR